ncbi:MAG: DUF4105 domain-containing protein [Candidatus Paceibacterota bacterium]
MRHRIFILLKYLAWVVLLLVLAYGALILFVHPSLNRDWSPDEVVLARSMISAEIRKEKGESFSAIKGLLRQYEIIYVIADEHDVIKLRSNYRKDDVFLYPVKTTKENMQKLFISMLTRANKLATEPEFYNTLTNTCTTNIVAHVNEIAPGRIPFSYKVLMPGYSDELARQVGLIDNTLSIEELRAKYRINDKALKYADDPLFSERIRE